MQAVVCEQVASFGDDVLVIDDVAGYHADLHTRPADFAYALENLDDPDLEPIANPRGRYVQWHRATRVRADAIPFKMSSTLQKNQPSNLASY